MHCKAAQPRSSEKNAASRAGQTPCTRWAVTISLLEQKASTTAANRAFEEKQPLVFLPKAANSWIHGGVRPQEARIWSWRRRWGEGSQNTAMLDSPDRVCVQGKLTVDVRRSSSRALSRHLRALLSACGKSCGLSRGPPLPARTPKVSSYIRYKLWS